MFSILVPVYNRDVRPLAAQLLKASERLGRPCEIIIAEDGSTEALDHNAALRNMPGVQYHPFKENTGRAAIRNTLAGMAREDHLIFLDCDIALTDADFLLNYEAQLKYEVVCGGHRYGVRSPRPCRLHHSYGLKRECLPAPLRNQHPYKSFKTSNFMIHKATFESIRFDEGLKEYGHEDTLFGYTLGARSIPILHIANEVEHLALETTDVFLDKSRQALLNGLRLVKSKRLPAEYIRAIDAYYRLKDNAAGRGLLEWLLRIEPFLREQVSSARPRMRSFDFLKLAWLRELDRAELN